MLVKGEYTAFQQLFVFQTLFSKAFFLGSFHLRRKG